jgi:exopolysaccharide production protein ExoQ
MPPPLALLLTTIFVVFLLKMEHKQDHEVPASSWLLTIWMLSISVKPLGRWFGWEAESIESGSPLDRAFLITLLCIGLILLAKRKFDFPTSIKENAWLFILVGYMLISILWSDIPQISFKRWTRELIAVVMALLLFSEGNPRRVLASIIRRVTYIAIPFSLVLVKYYPAYGVEFGRWSGQRMWIGVTTQKNGLGRLCIMSAFFLIWTLIRRLRGRDTPVHKYQTHFEVFLLLLTVVLLMGPQRSLTYSSTATFALTIALATFAGLYWLKKKGIIISRALVKILVFLIIVYGIITPFLGRLSFWDVSSILGRDETLTGRTEIWALLIPYAIERSLLGYGYGGFWTTDMRDSIYSDAHSGYLDTILNTGFVGLLFLTIFLLSCCHKAHKEIIRDFDWGCLFLCYLIMSVVHNIAESSIQTLTSSLSAYILLFSFSVRNNTNEDFGRGELALSPVQNKG